MHGRLQFAPNRLDLAVLGGEPVHDALHLVVFGTRAGCGQNSREQVPFFLVVMIDHRLLKKRPGVLRKHAGLAPTDWTPCLVHADPSLAISEQEVERACDLIVVGKHGRSVMEDLLVGSVTSHVLAESVGDVLVSTTTTIV